MFGFSADAMMWSMLVGAPLAITWAVSYDLRARNE